MSARITTAKRLLARYGNKLEQVVQKYKEEGLESLHAELSSDQKINRGNLRQLEEAVGAIESLVGQLESSLSSFLILRDSSPPSGTEPDDTDTYSIRAEECLVTAAEYMMLLQARIRAIKSCDSMFHPQVTTPQSSSETHSQAQTPKTRSVELPSLPIPKFKGNIWEWDNFWELFNANVHSQELPELFKFNYLLDALQGEAKESIRKFHVTKENYSKAISFLHNRYGSGEELIQKLINRLENYQLRSTSLKDHRSLFEQIQVIIQQLRQKGEQVDSQWMMKKILSKFPDEFQRKVLLRKRLLPSNLQPISMEVLFNLMEDVLSGEEMVQVHLEKPLKTVRSGLGAQRTAPSSKNRTLPCMYCQGDHKPAACKKFKTPQERAQYLREGNLCQLCASAHHATAECSRQPCFYCRGPHHTSCCFKAGTNSTSFSVRSSENTPHQQAQPQRREQRGERKQTKTTTRVNLVADNMSNPVSDEVAERSYNEGSVLSVQPSEKTSLSPKTFLPMGELSVVDPNTKRLQKIQVLIDTGAEMSFIETALAHELRLPASEEKQLCYYTFGSKQVQKKQSSRVQLPAWDNDGQLHILDLLTSDIFTKEFSVPPLTAEDSKALQSRHMQLPSLPSSKIQQVEPSILLGCDQAWEFLRINSSQVQLPSGLYVLPTTMGNILAGQLKLPQKIYHLRLDDEHEELTQWDNYWSLEPQVNMVHVEDKPADDVDDERKWERYWELESAGIHEFGNPEKEEKDRQDKEVWDNFNLTVERRTDGYYVKLPWKYDHPQLPDNYAIAMRRLHSVWDSLQKDQNLLQRYDAVFQEQIQMNILEDIPEDKPSSKSKIHYLAHQAVITPNKLTTKLRIVFDASAHYKGSPSLNEVLHRGPVILPQLFGILLRFRIGKIGIISDVEKAFLQVRLHESERDSTRCLWLWNYKKPPEPDNIRSLRFTRVAFGLTSSPFLLAATTHYHLDTYSSERDLVREIKNNLNVDNVLLTAESRQEAHHKYIKCKEMFSALSMNLREFVSNDERLMQIMDDKDRSADVQPKVLGIRWNSLNDEFKVHCSIGTDTHLSKRTVARAVASIYDPLGWLIPLTHRAKQFLQSLWKEGYGWDSTLSPSHAQQWYKIVNDSTGFEKIIPRVVATSSSKQVIVTFADASLESMAACVYLCDPPSSHLLMARERLRNAMTMPKMELNAITLATRLSETVVKELRSAIQIKYIYILSDSEIVLSWVKNHPIAGKSVVITNRLKEIDKIIEHLQSLKYEVHFGHVDSVQNPADCATRGLTKEQLATHFWWKGPKFLEEMESSWKIKNTIFKIKSKDEDQEPNMLLAAEAQSNKTKDDNYLVTPKQAATLTEAKRILAYALRFIRAITHKIQSKEPSQVKPWSITQSEKLPLTLTGEEVMKAGKVIIQHHQRTEITSEILKKVAHLRVRKDKDDILRCYGRLGASALETSVKYPIFILQKSFLAKLIISEYHQEAHPGVNHTMSLIRQTFWIPQLRSQVIREVRACIKCQRLNNLPFKYPEQSDLPPARVLQSKPFQHVGLDYFGPLFVRNAAGERQKCYGCIITCMVTRLIHLDIVSDSSTVSFLHMLRRFFGRRGIPTSITCDNAPTFLLGEEVLRERSEAAQVDPAIARALSNKEIKWKHITPYAPWQGGVYERLIKSVKYTLDKTLGKSTSSYEELQTVVVEIEAFLNTRPLLYSDSSMEPDSILRPIDFLQNHIQVYFPLEAKNDEDDDTSYVLPEEIPSLRTKQQTIQALQSSVDLTERAWKIWQTQYLTSLRERHEVNVKTKKGGVSSPREGILVLIYDETQPRHFWKMGRIEKLYPSTQGVIREAMIRLPSRRCIRRPINLLIPLELEGTTNNETENNESSSNITNTPTHSASHYNLRRRPTPVVTSTTALAIISLICCLLAIGSDHTVESRTTQVTKDKPKGVVSRSTPPSSYKICAEQIMKSPPQVIWHDHLYKLHFKFTRSNKVTCVTFSNELVMTGTSDYYHNSAEQRVAQVTEAYSSHCPLKRNTTSRGTVYLHASSTKQKILTRFFKSTDIPMHYLIGVMLTMSLNFRLPPRDLEGGPKYLSRMVIELNPTAERLETDMTATLNELKNQEIVTTSVRSDWFRLLCSASLREMGAAERIQLLDRYLLTVSLTKERLLRLGTRYILTDRIYEDNAKANEELATKRNEWLQMEDAQVHSKEIVSLVERDVRRLETTIKEITEYKVGAEKELMSNKRELDAAEVLTKTMRAMQDQLQTIQALSTQEESSRVAQQETLQATQETDDQYFDRLLRESSDEKTETESEAKQTKKSSESTSSSRQSDSEPCLKKRRGSNEKGSNVPSVYSNLTKKTGKKLKPNTVNPPPTADRSRELRKEIESMERTLANYPYRMLVEVSEKIPAKIDCAFCGALGCHYSDSCPIVIDGKEREQIALFCKRCIRCMKFCRGTCASEEVCWYCHQLRGTPFEDVIPPRKHHRAVCPVPDVKEVLLQRMYYKMEELANLEGESSSSRWWECRESDFNYIGRSSHGRDRPQW